MEFRLSSPWNLPWWFCQEIADLIKTAVRREFKFRTFNQSRLTRMNSQFQFRKARTGDEAGTSYVCLKTGDFGNDGEQFYIEDPDALARIFVWPYLAYE